MKLTDDKFNQKKEIKRGWTITRMITWVILFCVLIIVFVFAVNNKDAFVDDSAEASLNLNEQNALENIEKSELTSEDLQIWDEPETIVPVVEGSSEPEEDEENVEKNQMDTEPTEVPSGFFRITLDNGELETHKINTYLSENEYDYSLFDFDGKSTNYQFEDNRKAYVGISVSKEQGYIDFHKVKKDGIDFVMIAAGGRGYGTGQIVLDDYAKEHLRNASDANLEIGFYFKSQAITEDEAIEEAINVLSLIDGYQVTYPIAFEMERHPDEGRTEGLDRISRTKIAIAFLNTIKQAGYDTCIYGTPEFIINFIDLSQLQSFDLWLSQGMREPEIPYEFSMWEFSEEEEIDGVSGLVPVSVSMVDYQAK